LSTYTNDTLLIVEKTYQLKAAHAVKSITLGAVLAPPWTMYSNEKRYFYGSDIDLWRVVAKNGHFQVKFEVQDNMLLAVGKVIISATIATSTELLTCNRLEAGCWTVFLLGFYWTTPTIK